MDYKIELCKKAGKGKKWYWRLKSRNGQILAHSECYQRKTDARDIATKISTDLWGCEFQEVRKK